MTDREHLPARRHSLVFDLELNGLRFTASYSCFLDNRVGEIFLQNHKPGSQSDSNARDAAMAAKSRPAIRVSVADAAARGAARYYRSALDGARRRYRCNY